MAIGSVSGSKTKVDQDLLESFDYHQSDNHGYSGSMVKISLLFMVGVLIYLVISQPTYPAEFLERTYSIATSKIDSTSEILTRVHIDDEIIQEQASSSTTNDSSSNKLPPPLFHQLNSENVHVSITIDESIVRPRSITYRLVNHESVLEGVLRNASKNNNKTVIITTLNKEWTQPNSIFDLFLESFRVGNQTERLLNHLLVVALDKIAYARCMEMGLHCYALTTKGVDFSGAAYFMSNEYLKMMWRRIDFLRTVLELGYNFVFTDGDVMWLRDPFPIFFPNVDFQIACDNYNHNSTDLKNYPNGGFNYVKSNSRTIQFYKFWYTAKDYFPGKHDQDVFNKIKFNPFLWKIGLKIRFLDTDYFGGFCQPSKDLDIVVTMHANCCIGLDKKIHDIKLVLDDWNNYMMALPAGDHRNSTLRKWSPRICGWSKSK